MKRKFKKCMSGAMAAALLFTATPSNAMAGSVPISSGNVVEQDSVTVSEDDASISDNLENTDNPDVAEENETLKESVNIATGLKNEDAFDTAEENMTEADQAGADAEDITASFTDPNFRAAVRRELGLSDNEPITRTVCSQVEELDVNGKGIENLAGIEYFTSLRYLYCGGNQLTQLDVSGCTMLINLYYNDNQLTQVDVGNCSALKRLSCYRNQLTQLDVGNCPSLEYLSCGDNQLTQLDVGNCTSLTSLRCHGNYMKTADDVTGKNENLIGENFIFDPQRANTKNPKTLPSRPTSLNYTQAESQKS